MLTSTEIRQQFIDFFCKKHGHTFVPSSPVVPHDDPTLMFTNAGMNQFKDVFLGTGSRPYRRVADSQKCLRVAGKHNDLDDVGRDDTHHTFFEMLGNWSFGDYYKEEAIAWAWELLTGVWGLPKAELWATCFEDEKGEIPRDDEAADTWRRQPGFPANHVLFFGRKENFWEMADTGPCGPDSEIHIDLGPQACRQQDVSGHVCHVNGDCGRFVELWNLVFIQYNRTGPSDLLPLPRKHVDTGMGFDRVLSVLQGVDSNYKTDLFLPVMDRIQSLAGHTPEQRSVHLTPYRVIADHARAAAFLIADGVVPGNLGRHYVCRMIVRRASRFGGQTGIRGPFLAAIARVVVELYGEAYPELVQNQDSIDRWLTDEEERFQRTVESGVARATQMIRSIQHEQRKILPGAIAFDLYATYGLPLEITRDIAREQALEVDEVGFQQALETHRLTSAAGLGGAEPDAADGRGFQQAAEKLRAQGLLGPEGVEYDPYDGLDTRGQVLALFVGAEPVERAGLGQEVSVVLPRTTFYLEAGGQVSDTGIVRADGDGGWEIAVERLAQPAAGVLVHKGRVVRGSPRVGDPAAVAVDEARRWDIMRNHTATQLLHASLRRVLGEHARQAGSLVAPERLRFDFTHSSGLHRDELDRIERMVNEAILANEPVVVRFLPLKQAMSEGATALFGEAYGETVRTVRIGRDPWFSYELCGGTHVPETGVIGPFFIVSEASAAAGIRRIEAVTGRAAVEFASRHIKAHQTLVRKLGADSDQAEYRIDALLRLEKDHRKLSESRLAEEAKNRLEGLQPMMIGGVPVLVESVPDLSGDGLRTLVDQWRSGHATFVAVFGSAPAGKPVIVTGVSKDLVAKGLHAGHLAEAAA
ncbi:MAG: alanine--tRNA ligase, partial [Anaerolineales bacterium]